MAILISSPQALADNKKFRDQLLKCNCKETLRANVIDEAHLWAMHGKSFRDSIRVVGETYFKIVYGSNQSNTPLFMLMTATAPVAQIETMSKLTHVDWTNERFQMRSSMTEFQQRNVSMMFEVSSNLSLIAYPLILKRLDQNSDVHVCVLSTL